MQTEITLFDISLALCLASFAATVLCLAATAFPARLQRLKQVAGEFSRTRPPTRQALFLREGNRRDSRVRVVRPSLTSNSVR
jgi:hypothetical protein